MWNTFSMFQRSHVPQTIMDVMYGLKPPPYSEFNVKNEPVSRTFIAVRRILRTSFLQSFHTRMFQMSPPELTIDIKEEPHEEPVSV